LAIVLFSLLEVGFLLFRTQSGLYERLLLRFSTLIRKLAVFLLFCLEFI